MNDQPITKGSFGKLDQGVIGTADANDGRQVYYSNVLMPTDTSMTVSVALNTSKIGAENTEGITEGETVTANVFLSAWSAQCRTRTSPSRSRTTARRAMTPPMRRPSPA